MRNFQASANMKAMKVGDRVFFYHSNEGLAVVGIAEVSKTYYPDPTDKTQRFGMVDIKPVQPFKTPGRPWPTSRRTRSSRTWCW